MAATSERAHGPAAVLALGTANPPNLFEQNGFADFYFNATDSNHMTDLKSKFQRICDRSSIKRRYMHITEGILEANPSMCTFSGKSLDARQNMLIVEVPKLGNEAALKAILEWGQPRSKITHLIFCTTTGVDMPGADWALTKLLGLAPTVQRIMLYQQGCAAGGTVLRIAKDFAENNKDARVLVVCSELTLASFRGPDENHMKNLIGQALFGDGAAALIVGADPIPEVEKPCFTIHWVGSCLLPCSDGAVEGHLTEAGMVVQVGKEIPFLISEHIYGIVKDAFHKAFGKAAPDHDDVFWIIHPGGPAILNQVEIELKIKPAKLYASRAVLSNYGNMFSASVFFVMDIMRKRSLELKCTTSGEGHEWGVLLGFGPGLTVETVILKSAYIGE